MKRTPEKISDTENQATKNEAGAARKNQGKRHLEFRGLSRVGSVNLVIGLETHVKGGRRPWLVWSGTPFFGRSNILVTPIKLDFHWN